MIIILLHIKPHKALTIPPVLYLAEFRAWQNKNSSNFIVKRIEVNLSNKIMICRPMTWYQNYYKGKFSVELPADIENSLTYYAERFVRLTHTTFMAVGRSVSRCFLL